MRVMERGGRYKRETDHQSVPGAPKMIRFVRFVPPRAGINIFLEAVRQKREYATRGK